MSEGIFRLDVKQLMEPHVCKTSEILAGQMRRRTGPEANGWRAV